jgi:hypothetical protein
MAEHRYAVGAEQHVGLDEAGAGLDRLLEREPAVLRVALPITAMGDQPRGVE